MPQRCDAARGRRIALRTVCKAHAAVDPFIVGTRMTKAASARATQVVFYGLIGVSVGGALVEGTETRLGLTFWRAAESGLGARHPEVLQRTFTRPRPSQINDPDLCSDHYTAFSSETASTAVVTPFIIEYAQDYPGVWALAAIPVWIARLKSQAHWQLTCFSVALGVATALLRFEQPSEVDGDSYLFLGLRYRW